MASVDLSVSGLASGVDWKTLITALANAERTPETQWQATQSTLSQQNNSFGTIKSYLNNLQAAVDSLKDTSIYNNRSASVSNSAVASASADNAALTGTFTFNITQLATAAVMNGTPDIAKPIATSSDVSGVTVGTAGFATPVTAGTFTVNGAQVTIATTDSLQDVFNKIATATNNAVTASYDSTADEIKLSSSSEIILGSGSDTSNFLQVAQLYNNGGNTISSANALGNISLGSTLSSADLNTAITDGGSGAGAFTINGVSISFNAGNDSVQDVIDRINSSSAGVSASYDTINKKFVLTNKATGDLGISLQDVTGNFLAATGLSGGSLTHGQNLQYNLNGGSQTLTSQSNTITSTSSGITGLSVTALNTGTTTVTVGSDTSAISSAINSFVTAYNNVQSYISTQEATSTDSSGNVTAGLLTGDLDASAVATNLRSYGFAQISGLSGALDNLAKLGITTSGYSNTITLDSSTLSDTLASNLNGVKSFFTDSTNGWAVKFDAYLTNTIGDNGTLVNHQQALTDHISSISNQISQLEKTVAADTARWTAEFQTMETTQSQINQEMSYLSQEISKGNL